MIRALVVSPTGERLFSGLITTVPRVKEFVNVGDGVRHYQVRWVVHWLTKTGDNHVEIGVKKGMTL